MADDPDQDTPTNKNKGLIADEIDKYDISINVLRALDNSYTYHPPKGDQAKRYVIIRDAAHAFAITLCENAPTSRELSIALTDLEKVVTMANKAIACNE